MWVAGFSTGPPSYTIPPLLMPGLPGYKVRVVDRNNKPPIWDRQTYGPIYVKENSMPGHTVTSVKARFVLGLRNVYKGGSKGRE